jgi:hypothetical protein
MEILISSAPTGYKYGDMILFITEREASNRLQSTFCKLTKLHYHFHLS